MSGCTCDGPACIACYLRREGAPWVPDRQGDTPTPERARQRFTCARLAGSVTMNGPACASRFAQAEEVLLAPERQRMAARYKTLRQRLGGSLSICGGCPAGAARAALLGLDPEAASPGRTARRAAAIDALHAGLRAELAAFDNAGEAVSRNGIDWRLVAFDAPDPVVAARLRAAGHHTSAAVVGSARRRLGHRRRNHYVGAV